MRSANRPRLIGGVTAPSCLTRLPIYMASAAAARFWRHVRVVAMPEHDVYRIKLPEACQLAADSSQPLNLPFHEVHTIARPKII